MSADTPESNEPSSNGHANGDANNRSASLHFRTLDLAEVKLALESICEVVAGGRGRIEIAACDDDHRCVIISKRELDDLERALAILAGTRDTVSACEHLRRLAAAALEGLDESAANRFAESN